MFDESRLPHHRAITIVGRLFFTLIFFMSGITHFTDAAGYVALMPASTPFALFWVWISGIVELAGAAMILFDKYAKIGAWLLVIFLVPVTIVVHGYAMVTTESEQMQAAQLSFFLKGVTMTGAALLISQFGATHPVRPENA